MRKTLTGVMIAVVAAAAGALIAVTAIPLSGQAPAYRAPRTGDGQAPAFGRDVDLLQTAEGAARPEALAHEWHLAFDAGFVARRQLPAVAVVRNDFV